MSKAQAAALLLAGATAGVGGKTVATALLDNTVQAATVRPTAHAVDLRRDFNGDGLKFSVYGNQGSPDGGSYADLGVAKKCSAPSDVVKKQLNDCMNAAGAACTW